MIGNGNDQTALVKLISRLVNAKACVSVILPKSSVTISRVPDGHYELEFALGDEIMTGTETFWQPMAHRKFAKPLEFSTSQQYVDGRIITKTPHLTVTLHSVKDGNASMVSIPPSEFDRY